MSNQVVSVLRYFFNQWEEYQICGYTRKVEKMLWEGTEHCERA